MNMSLKNKKPLMHCEILHELPGRIRIGCSALQYLDSKADEIQERLEDMAPVRSASVTVLTSNVLVAYDRRMSTSQEILSMAEALLAPKQANIISQNACWQTYL